MPRCPVNFALGKSAGTHADRFCSAAVFSLCHSLGSSLTMPHGIGVQCCQQLRRQRLVAGEVSHLARRSAVDAHHSTLKWLPLAMQKSGQPHHARQVVHLRVAAELAASAFCNSEKPTSGTLDVRQ